MHAEIIKRGVVIRSFFTFACACLWAGCGAAPQPAELQNLAPVTGRVTFQGAPTPGAVVTLHPTDPQQPPRASGVVDDDGWFEISSSLAKHVAPGAVPGEYRVTVAWHAPAPTSDDPERTKSLLPVRYADPHKSKLTVVVDPDMGPMDDIHLTP